jgi:predicted TIM-barrel enzyme
LSESPGLKKPIVAMVHFPPSPGSSAEDAATAQQARARRGRHDLTPLVNVGIEFAAAFDTPVLATTAVRIDTAADTLEIADAGVVGTRFKDEGDTWKPVDPDREKRFVDHVRSLG